MPQTNTQKEKIEQLLTRGVENIYPSKEFLRKLLFSGKRIRVYLGVDPTGVDLHLGHAIPLMKLRQFQDLGHEVILLIGDFTGMIGDPTDKSATRQKLTLKQIKENYKNYKKQAAMIIDFSKCKIKYNSQWLGKLRFGEVVELASNFTVQQMLARDMFERRIQESKPIYLHEFLYPLMQAYDSVAMEVNGEVGGNDQTFNMLAGRDLIKILKNKEKFVLTTKLLVDPSGKKMGKTEGNMITLTDPAEEKFGKIMSWSDELIGIGFELLTQKDLSEVKNRLQAGENPRDLKLELAWEVVSFFHSTKEADLARENFIKVFSQKQKPKDMKRQKISSNKRRLDALLVELGLVNSKSAARRLVEQGGVKIDEQIIKNWLTEVIPKNGMLVRVGKRRFIELDVE